MQRNQAMEDDLASIAARRAERRSSLALVRLLLYAAAEADELSLPECATLVIKAAADVKATIGLTEEEIQTFPT